MPRSESSKRRQRRMRSFWRDNSLCTDCGLPLDGKTAMCERCRLHRAEREKINRKAASGKVAEMKRALGLPPQEEA